MKTYIGIDNGTTGTIGLRNDDLAEYYKTPIIFGQDYHKEKKNVSRIDVLPMNAILKKYKPSLALLERPMVDKARWKASMTAVRAFEATLIIIEANKIPRMIIDSKEWQSVMLPKKTKGSDALKKASHDVGIKLFPHLADLIKKHGDADGILIAEWARRMKL